MNSLDGLYLLVDKDIEKVMYYKEYNTVKSLHQKRAKPSNTL